MDSASLSSLAIHGHRRTPVFAKATPGKLFRRLLLASRGMTKDQYRCMVVCRTPDEIDRLCFLKTTAIHLISPT